MIATLLLAAAAAAAATPAPNDYNLGQNWLCRPDRRDACTIPLDATAITPDGTMTVTPFVRAKAPEADCFYVYPTVSFDRTGNSDMVANEEERKVIEAQFARFGSQCRTFAPLYRQVTLSALQSVMYGSPIPLDRELAYTDVRAAWRHYLANDNQGRPFVLIGHSQGSGVLKRLIAEEIDGKPLARQMLSAILAGSNILVAKGKDTGGDFKTTPLCRKATQTGCIVTYVSFRDTAPPPAKSRFGKSDKPDLEVACTNPAALGGGKAEAHSAFAAGRSWEMARDTGPWSKTGAAKTAFVTLPGLITAQCASTDGANYLSVHVNADPADPRTDDVPGDVAVGKTVLADWGLHLIDVSLAYDDLVALVPQQLAAWKAGKR
ncbi:DUF3089 domain-containing protein [Sphingomonas sp. SUN039]|uniref:DUF3089 domain-containing protein n=1 Tax=Sphingomonas sp. SUN039 TaxID=2937787 RepID=UPI002164ADDE|nr:DUF3089 domain-containing protein [Sphingomonas sp. SUN039]UVO53231.1 DUF3089 domain-containing protein [Sphingomonas sp. SUN039]